MAESLGGYLHESSEPGAFALSYVWTGSYMRTAWLRKLVQDLADDTRVFVNM